MGGTLAWLGDVQEAEGALSLQPDALRPWPAQGGEGLAAAEACCGPAAWPDLRACPSLALHVEIKDTGLPPLKGWRL